MTLRLIPNVDDSFDTKTGAGQAIDLAAAERAAAQFLTALGIDVTVDVLCDTPARMARAFAQLLTPPDFTPTTFDNDAAYDGLVVIRGIRFASLCEHHGLPFVGSADVAYLPDKRLAGLSKPAWAVGRLARRLQVQERLTAHLADWLEAELQPLAVAVRIRADHMCMRLRGAQTPDATTVTTVFRGQLVDDPFLRAEWAQAIA